MFDYTHQNHFKYGYNGKWFCNRTTIDDVFQCEYGFAKQTLDLKTANNEAAKLIKASTDKPLVIMMSGGVDSEVVARSFKDAGIDFTVAILRFSDNLNQHDIMYAEDWCLQNNVDFRYYDLNPLKFWFSKHAKELVEKTQNPLPDMLCTMWLVEQIDGFPIIGQGEPYVYKSPNGFVFREREVIISWYKHMINYNIHGIAGFFQYLPEQMLAILDDNITKSLSFESNDQIKYNIYKQYYSDLKPRPKYTGAEMLLPEIKKVIGIKLFNRMLHETIKIEHNMPYNDFLKYLKRGLPDSI